MRAPSASAIINTLSLRRIQRRRSTPSAVAPLPEKSRFDEQLTAELDTLQPQQGADDDGLVRFLDASIATQKIALQMFAKIPHDANREEIEDFLENNVEILDACNYFLEKTESVKKYMDSLRTALRFVEIGRFETRAMEHLEICREIERNCRRDDRKSRLGKMLRRNLKPNCDGENDGETEFGEIMRGSNAIALMACRFLELGLSFESKRRVVPKTTTEYYCSQRGTRCCWLRVLQERMSSCWIMSELKETGNSVKNLQEEIKGKKKMKKEREMEGLLKRNLRGLEKGIESIEERVKDLYKSLIDVRMALMGILSQA